MWNPDEGQAEYEAQMQAEAEAEMEAQAAYAEYEAEMAEERNKIISELEEEIQMHLSEINRLQKHIDKLSK